MRSKNAQMVAQFRHHFGLPVKSFPSVDGVDLDLHEKSNLSKLMPDGTVLRRDDGKVLKGPNFTPPDLRALAGK